MEELQRQVVKARRRLSLQQFLQAATWALFAALAVAALGLAIPKIWVVPVDAAAWQYGWLGSAAAAGFLAALAWTWLRGPSTLEAAVEIDRRFGLKERVASTLSLAADERDTEAGRALTADAVDRVASLEVGERFRVQLGARALLPLLPAAAVFALIFFVPNALPENTGAATAGSASQEQVKRAAEELKKRIEEQKKKVEEQGLKEAGELFQKLAEGIDKLQAQGDVDRKKALIELSELSKDLEKRRQELGSTDELRKQLEGLKDLEKGPAERLAKAMKEGEFREALQELQKLRDKLADGNLTDEEKEKLLEQLNQMADKLNQAADALEQAKRELERQIQEKLAQGDREAAGQLQQQLDQLNQQQQKLNEMASKLSQCAQCMKQGDGEGAAGQLDELASELDQLAQEMDELESLDSALDQLAQAKEGMACKQCKGEGCAACQGLAQGQGQGQGDQPGRGLGEGQGIGDRPEEATDTDFVDSQVRDKPRPGEAVRAGDAGGPNIAGVTRAAEQEAIATELPGDADPLAEQRLPKGQREHARQYFDLFREGKKE